MSEKAREALREVFGYEGFRPLQEEIIDAVLSGDDALAVMPTGGGKSLCYQVPGLVLEARDEGLALVVSPLIALMREQVAFLRGLGARALLLNSTLSPEEWRANAETARSGGASLLYMAPETLASPRFRELLPSLRVGLLAVDEAHCISEWGHDFRPEYRMLGELRASVRNGKARAPCLALTATATERVRRDIAGQLGLKARGGAAHREFVAGFDRPNIQIEVRRRLKAADQILDLASNFPEGTGIVYCFSRARAEDLAESLSAKGLPALPYHAGLPSELRGTNQDAFIRDQVRVIAATTAFGMGIDKPDVRFVVHADLPKSLEQYYQEIGRAGRDGLPAKALLLFGYGDAMKIRALLRADIDDAEEDEGSSMGAYERGAAAETALEAMVRYAESPACRRAALLEHFGETYPADNCGSCDVCTGSTDELAETDATTFAMKFLSCVKRTGERFGAGHVIDVLLGSRNERVMGLGHAELSTWGIGKELSKQQWMDLARQLHRKGYLVKDEEFGVLALSSRAYAAFRDKEPIRAVIPPPAKGKGARGAAAGSGAMTGGAAGGAAAADPRAASLGAALRALRRRLADEGRVPPYMIFSDRTLAELVASRPADEEALLEVFGMGKIKVQRFGRAILETLSEHQQASSH